MKKLSYLILAAIITFSFTSCKKEGCTDPLALNYDEDATKSNNDCRFSIVTFYASGDSFTGVEVTEIELTIGQSSENIGTISSFNQPFPSDCSVAGTVKYDIKTGANQTWQATYKLISGGVVTNSGEFSPSNSEACIKIDVLP